MLDWPSAFAGALALIFVELCLIGLLVWWLVRRPAPDANECDDDHSPFPGKP